MDENSSPVLWVMLMGAALVVVVGVVSLFGIDSAAATAAAALVN